MVSMTRGRRWRRAASALALGMSVTGGMGAAAAAARAQGATTPAAPASVNETPEHAAKMAWFRQAKYGLFIHWGLYAIPAGEWKGQPVAGIGEWIMNRAKIPVKEYEQLANQFDPKHFDPDAWAQMAQDAGMKYVVLTAKHHEGFAMFHSKVSPYNVYDATPFHRDVVKELADACARHHLKFGVYYSQAQDWHEPNGAGNTWDFGPDDKKDYDQYLRTKAEPQIKELLTGYGPLCLIWFDTPRMMTAERAGRFTDLVRTLQPNCLIDGRLGAAGDYRSMGDNRIPDQVVQEDWEVPATLNHTWGYKKDDKDWKSPAQVVFNLMDIVSKGGNYLLNVGPTADGVMPQPAQDVLRSAGRWIKANSDAVYGAGPSPFGVEFGAPSATETDPKTGKPRFIAAKDWRCTTKPGRLYLTLFTWPADGTYHLTGLKGTVTRAYLLADQKKRPLKVTQDIGAGTLAIALPSSAPDPIASVVCLETTGGG